jgi:FkbM family methyltransferase
VKRIIYDLGCHNGSNIPYYLLKADVVIAVDANPKVCEIIRSRFKKEIKQQRLIVNNFIITHQKSGSYDSFYIFEDLDVCSTVFPETKLFYKNKKLEKSDYSEVKVITKNILDLVDDYGNPFYIKIDLENYDHIILKEIFKNKITPKYISSECHNNDVFNLMIAQDEYNYFKLLKGNHLKSEKYRIKDLNGFYTDYEFPAHSAGPFGEDIKEDWLSKDIFKFDFFLRGGPSWVDIHALRSN